MTLLTDALQGGAPKPPAGVVAAVLRGGEVEVAAAGPVAEYAVFELGSMTKAVTGLLLADAVQRGEVELETPLSDCLPGARPLALGDLASHSAGLPRLPLAFLRRRRVWDLTDPYAGTTVDELLADLARVRIRTRRMRYSNFGAALLGQALAARAGTPYEALVEERVLRPLGVSEVWARDAPPPAQPHDRRGRPVQAWELGAYAPAGCLRGTLALAAACLDPPEPMRAAGQLALTPRAGRGPIRCGLGWMRSPLARGTDCWWHNGGTHGSRSFTGFVPATGAAVAVLVNAPKPPDALARRLLAGR